MFSCDICKYNATNETILKRHLSTKKHEKNLEKIKKQNNVDKYENMNKDDIIAGLEKKIYLQQIQKEGILKKLEQKDIIIDNLMKDNNILIEEYNIVHDQNEKLANMILKMYAS